mmetsp:Transcript_12245/g.13980  ORF Transcript_12245/g.13980 Transcript_12245/m.13980 type:complete len:155 (-) Transcript_12245:686-1150(-)
MDINDVPKSVQIICDLAHHDEPFLTTVDSLFTSSPTLTATSFSTLCQTLTTHSLTLPSFLSTTSPHLPTYLQSLPPSTFGPILSCFSSPGHTSSLHSSVPTILSNSGLLSLSDCVSLARAYSLSPDPQIFSLIDVVVGRNVLKANGRQVAELLE